MSIIWRIIKAVSIIQGIKDQKKFQKSYYIQEEFGVHAIEAAKGQEVKGGQLHLQIFQWVFNPRHD